MAFGKDWKVIAITFERPDLFRINGNRGQGRDATKIRDNVKAHNRTLYWAVYDLKDTLLESGPGGGADKVPERIIERLAKEFEKNSSVLAVVKMIGEKGTEKAAKQLLWEGHVKDEKVPSIAGEYILVAKMGDGEELESKLKLTQQGPDLLGAMISPDGQEMSLSGVAYDTRFLSFFFILEEDGARTRMNFKGRIKGDTITGLLAPA